MIGGRIGVLSDRFVQIERKRCKVVRTHIGCDSQRRTIVVEVNLSGDISRCKCRVAVAIGDRDGRKDRVVCKGNLIVRICAVQVVLDRQIFDHGYSTGQRVDRDGECGLANQQTAINAADNNVAVQRIGVEADCRSVRELQSGRCAVAAIECERISDRVDSRRSVNAEIRKDSKCRRVVYRKCKRIPGVVRIVTDIRNARENRKRSRNVIVLAAGRFVRSDAKAVLQLNRNRRSIVFKTDIAGNIGRCRSLVSVAVRYGDRRLDGTKRVTE